MPQTRNKRKKPQEISDPLLNRLRSTLISGFLHERPEIDSYHVNYTNIETVKNIPGFFRDKFPSRRTLINRLRLAYSARELSLVLGSGVSLEHGIPSWKELILGALITVFSSQKSSLSIIREFSRLYVNLFFSGPIAAARHIETLNKNKRDKVNFVQLLTETLYSRESFKENSPLYRSVTNICASARTSKSVASIITYNFDDLLETYLEKLTVNIPFEPIVGPSLMKSRSNSLPIYHVHGFLPRDQKYERSTNVVFAEDDYHMVYKTNFHWSNIVQLRTFSENTCLFVGLSMTDPNLRRLLDASVLLKRPGSTTRHVVVEKAFTPALLTSRLGQLLNDRDVPEDVRSVMENPECQASLISLYQIATNIELRSLGCDVLFVQEYDEIPKIIDQIRE